MQTEKTERLTGNIPVEKEKMGSATMGEKGIKPGDRVTLKEDFLFCPKRREWIFHEMRGKDVIPPEA